MSTSKNLNSQIYPPIRVGELKKESVALSNNKVCLQLYNELMQSVVTDPNDVLESKQWLCSPLDELQALVPPMLIKLVNYSYNARYLNSNLDYTEVINKESINLSDTRTFVVYQILKKCVLVLGTCRIKCGNLLETFEIIEMKDGYIWPHLQDPRIPKKVAESSRIAFHPIFDINRRNKELHQLTFKMRQHIYRMIWLESVKWMQLQQVKVFYMILAPRIRSFMENSGVQLLQVEGAQITHSTKVQLMRRQFSKYWLPDSPTPEQPTLYTAKWDLIF